MTSSLFYTAQLGPSDLKDIQTLEQNLGVTLVAMDCDSSSEPAQLNAEQLQQLQALEQKSGKVLLAYA
ncbi:hypothetical protein N9052_02755 [bacterium]|jgi:hypothetical protein|uniref:Uncharacterized protein n=1 Tax=Candidatus Marimicrobium litorale TaxID=2518991 RepID=A0ABT3T8E2_9GAMM|nr:hypothetical protein [Candidatus Marimicrobium litorale]MCX2978549.1 hypothetical protein [Candidatus Marimicrobium litorale]MDB4476481.1 hypothetical protein [bacterium]